MSNKNYTAFVWFVGMGFGILSLALLISIPFAWFSNIEQDRQEAEHAAWQATSTTTTTIPRSTTTTTISPDEQARRDRENLNAEIRAEIEQNNRKLGASKFHTPTTTTQPPPQIKENLTFAESCALFWPDNGTYNNDEGWAVCMYGEDTNEFNAWFNAYWDMQSRSRP